MHKVGLAVPARAAHYLTEQRMSVVFGAATRAAWQVQARFPGLSAAERKAQAYDLAKNDYELNRQVLGVYPDVDEYVERALLPSALDGVVLTFNQALWFETAKIIEVVGGANNPAPPPAVSSVPGPPPPPPIPVSDLATMPPTGQEGS